MKSSKVPHGRYSRLGALASLAGRVASNVAWEGAKQFAQGNRPSRKDLVMSPANIAHVADKLADLRGAAMKVGQLLSMDAGDLIPPELSDLLARLRNHATPMPSTQLNQVLTEQWGPEWKQAFTHFRFSPIASASIGQVHEAYTDAGDKVAVKVQYPRIKDSIDSDVDNVITLLRLSGLIPKEANYQALLDEAKQQLHDEADYRKEANAMLRFHERLNTHTDLVVPTVHSTLTTDRVLIMDYMAGEPIETLTKAEPAVRHRAVSQLFILLFEEVFVFGEVQTDPNFANYLYQPESGRIVLLDFGATRQYTSRFTEGYRKLFLAAIEKDNPGIDAALTQIGFFAEAILPEQKASVLELVNTACEPIATDAPFNFGQADLATRLRNRGMALSMEQGYWHTPPADALFLHRKIAGLYLLAAKLDVTLNVRALLMPYLTAERVKTA
ncbi:ubiquinol-cytochrome C reductase [Salinivibrio sp. PR5]|uniref:ABC1 kinase family protein n=1 Tax=Salinivibrio sp. PR5 TaxID=1909484 RepID=UPI000989E9BD|nr:AarF/ABC1/UbiB kinase family protein [Salinivibrio sp. PR5]OOF10079.1 ubiquinol-cytochrome C reductase [Salinivibrio sp. PR5]